MPEVVDRLGDQMGGYGCFHGRQGTHGTVYEMAGPETDHDASYMILRDIA